MFRSIQHTVNCNEESYEICSIPYDWFLKWTMIQFLRQFLFKILLLFAEKIRSLVRDTRAKNRVLWKSLCDQKILIGGCRACFSDLSQISQIITDKKMFLTNENSGLPPRIVDFRVFFRNYVITGRLAGKTQRTKNLRRRDTPFTMWISHTNVVRFPVCNLIKHKN